MTFVWDDSDSGEVTVSEPVDGPSTLRSFTGDMASEMWQLNMIDNTPNHTGQVERLHIRLGFAELGRWGICRQELQRFYHRREHI